MADPVVNLQYASKYASSSNSWKKWIGMRESFAKLNIIEREEQKEAAFTSWVNSKKKRVEEYGDALQTISSAVEASTEAEKAYALLTESIYRIELVGFSRSMFSSYELMKRGGSDDTEIFSMIQTSRTAYSHPLRRSRASLAPIRSKTTQPSSSTMP